MSIRGRIALFTSVVILATLLGFGLLLQWLVSSGQASQQDQQLRSAARAAAGRLPADVGSLESNQFLIRDDLRSSDRVFVEVLDSTGQPISSSGVVAGTPPEPPAGLLRHAAGGETFGTISWRGTQLRVCVEPLPSPLSGDYVVAGIPTRVLANSVAGLRFFVVFAAVLSLIAAAAASWWVAGGALRPLGSVLRTVDEIGGTEDLSRRLAEPRRQDEVGRLARGFNAMLGRLQDAHQRLESTLEAQRRFVADASHDLRTPLTSIRSNAELLRARPDVAEADRRAALDDILGEAQRMSRLVEDMLALARADSGQRLELARLDLAPVVQDVVRQASALNPDRQLRLRAYEPRSIAGDGEAVRRLLWILLDNAVRHTSPNGHVDVDLGGDGGEVRLAVCDDGEGIPAAELERVFERFHRVDASRSGGGAGLGLSIARWIVAEHGGTIRASRNPVRGVTFSVILPEAPPTPTEEG